MKKDVLFRLIHALDEGELRYCRKALKKATGSMAEGRLLLFDSLNRMSNNSTDHLLKLIANHPVANNLSVEKHRLYQKLLTILNRLRIERDGPNGILRKLEECRTLMELGLFDEAAKAAQVGIKKAVNLEELIQEVTLRELLRESYKNMNRQFLEKQITKNEYALQTATRKLVRLANYTVINDRMSDYHKKFRVTDMDSVNKGKDELMKRAEMLNENLADSLPSRLRYNYVQSLYYMSNLDYTAALDSKRNIVWLWETNPARIKQYPHFYRSAISNLLGVMNMTGRLEGAEIYLQKMELVETKGRRAEILKFTQVELQYFLFYMNSGRLDDALKREEVILAGLTKYKKGIPNSSRLTFLYNLAITHLVCDNYGDALRLFNQIKGLGRLPTRKDLQGIARLLWLLLLCEDDSAGGFEHYLRNSKKFFTEGSGSYLLEDTVYKWIRSHHKLIDKESRNHSFGLLISEIEPIAQQKKLGAEEILLWATAKFQNTTIRSIYLAGLKK